MCSSIGLDPIKQPPGRGIFAFPNLARRGPMQKKLTLRAWNKSKNKSCDGGQIFLVFISNWFESDFIFIPIAVNILDIINTSEIWGTLKRLIWPLERIEAAIKTKAEFFAPLIFMFPLRNSPPSISKYFLLKTFLEIFTVSLFISIS